MERDLTESYALDEETDAESQPWWRVGPPLDVPDETSDPEPPR